MSERPEQVPMSRLENQAWGDCRRGGHGWMENLAFETHAFKTSERLEERDLSDGGTLRSIYLEGRCNFCGYSKRKTIIQSRLYSLGRYNKKRKI